MTDVVSLAAELLAIPSPTGAEGAVVDFVSKWLIAKGWNVSLQEVTRGRSNIWASRGAKKGVTLSTHLDTVPPPPPAIPIREDNEFLYGRGACHTKGIIAAML